MAQVIESDVKAFRAGFGGTVLAPDDAGYDQARSIWNGDIDKRPAVVARCVTSADVAAAIRFARGQDLEIAVRGGGHSPSGASLVEGGLVIDLTQMNEVRVDPAARRAIVGGGASLAQLDAATQAHGLAVPAGTVSHTGVAGLTLGGGAGWLTARAGLSIDNLVSAEVVTADGAVLRASASENPDLFWAIRGGGGNFGVVTSFEFRLHEVGPLVNLGLFFWGLDQGPEALRYVRDFVDTLPEDMGVVLAGFNAPPAPFVPEHLHFSPGYALLVVGFGSPDEHRRALAPIHDACPPLIELVTPIPYTQLQQLIDDANPWGVHAYDKGLNVDALTDDVISVFTEHMERKRSPMTQALAVKLGGAFLRAGEDDTAFSGARTPAYAFAIIGMTPTGEGLDAERAWVRSLFAGLRQHTTSARAYINFAGVIEQDTVRALYGSDKYDRLARIKARYDPDNVFHLNANIEPAPDR